MNKDEKQSTPSYNSQLSQESNSNQGKPIERQSSQPASSSYTASQTCDEFRLDNNLDFCNYCVCCFRLKSRSLIANAFSISEIPEGSADPVEVAARVEDGRTKKNSHGLIIVLLFSYIQRIKRYRCQISKSCSKSNIKFKRFKKSKPSHQCSSWNYHTRTISCTYC